MHLLLLNFTSGASHVLLHICCITCVASQATTSSSPPGAVPAARSTRPQQREPWRHARPSAPQQALPPHEPPSCAAAQRVPCPLPPRRHPCRLRAVASLLRSEAPDAATRWCMQRADRRRPHSSPSRPPRHSASQLPSKSQKNVMSGARNLGKFVALFRAAGVKSVAETEEFLLGLSEATQAEVAHFLLLVFLTYAAVCGSAARRGLGEAARVSALPQAIRAQVELRPSRPEGPRDQRHARSVRVRGMR
jgi:hypothetical protein